MNAVLLGKFLKKLRVKNKLSQKELATRLGLKTSQFISNIERGVSQIPSTKIREFANVLNFEADDLANMLSESYKNKICKRNSLIESNSDDDIFLKNFIIAWKTAGDKDKESLKIIISKMLNIES